MKGKRTFSIDEVVLRRLTQAKFENYRFSESIMVEEAIVQYLDELENVEPEKLLIPFFRNRANVSERDFEKTINYIVRHDPNFDFDRRFESEFYNNLSEKYSLTVDQEIEAYETRHATAPEYESWFNKGGAKEGGASTPANKNSN